MDGFLILLASVVVFRGVASGIISGILLITLPVQKQIGLIPYAQLTRAIYKSWGVKVYAGLTGIGLLLTLVLATWTFRAGQPAWVSWMIVASAGATFVALGGTAGAFPAMRMLWKTPDTSTELVARLLRRFARWGIFSAFWHVAAFGMLVVALAM